jgi:coenzyme F420-reducing hydrogenase beta subunit
MRNGMNNDNPRIMTLTETCTGCGACYNICPKNAIVMTENKEGFLFPAIDDEKCIHCGLCDKNCPILTPIQFNQKVIKSYAAMANDEIRGKSASGGMFFLAADYILKQGGVVCGAGFSHDFLSVCHEIVDNHEKLKNLLTSKYVQSNIKLTYKEVELILKTGRLVLFSGCPCQVAGLKNYLGFDYSNLLCLDLICHGVPSPKAWRMYAEEMRKKNQIVAVNFRNKKDGWSTPRLLLQLNNGIKFKENNQTPYL